MRFVVAVAMLLGLSGYAHADPVVTDIKNGKATPYSVNMCTENSTKRVGLCGFFRKIGDTTVYLAFQFEGEAQWIKRIPKEGEAQPVYVLGELKA